MLKVIEHDIFIKWMAKLHDNEARVRIFRRLQKLKKGQFGDHKDFHGIGELRIDYGPGYRVYYTRKGSTIIVVLAGGDKRTQQADIKKALALVTEIEGGKNEQQDKD